MSIAAADAAVDSNPAASRRGGRRTARWLRLALVVGLVAAVAADFASIRQVLTSALADAWRASAGWLVMAVVLAAFSMVAFGVLRRRTVAAAGGELPLREAVAVSYAAGAIHMTTPGGVIASTAYAFRRLHRVGVPAGAIAWSLTVSGILSSAALVAVGVFGLAVDDPGSWVGLVPTAAVVAVAATAAVIVVRHSAAVWAIAAVVLRRGNRLLRRPDDTGMLALRAAAAWLRAVRATRADWLRAGTAAATNWLLDLLCLWACAEALGIRLPPWALLASYALAMAGAGVSPLPGGVGVVDGIVVIALTAGGHVPVSVAVAAVLLYRVISLGSLLLVGWGLVAAQAVPTLR